MSKHNKSSKQSLPYVQIADYGKFKLFRHTANDLTVLHYPRPDTGVVTTNITYKVGSVDEKRGESGLAHMLEHMLFKPTKRDLERGILSGSAMAFERSTGAVLNANTSYDRTTYYFSFPQQYLDKVLTLEADRMQQVVLNDTEFLPEQGNVLSEFDMYNGDPYFALEVAMRTAAFQSHAYDHEVIGFREDIEDYTTDKLQRFYDMYYQPNNAVLMLVGDMAEEQALAAVHNRFGKLKNRVPVIERETAREPQVTGGRTVSVARPGSTNILAIGFHHEGFPSSDWHAIELAMRVLAGGPESILHKKLVDTGLVSNLSYYVFATTQPNLGTLFLKLAPDAQHDYIRDIVLETIDSCTTADFQALLKREKTKWLTDEAFSRANSLGLVGDLTSYVVGDAFTQFNSTEEILKSITTKQCVAALKKAYHKDVTVTGYYTSV